MLQHNSGYQNLTAQLWLIAYLLFIFYMKPYQLRTIINMEAVSVVAILILLYQNLWMLLAELTEPFSYHRYESVFAFFVILVVICALITLTVMALYAYVAAATKKKTS